MERRREDTVQKEYDDFSDVIYHNDGSPEGGSLAGFGMNQFEKTRDRGIGPDGDVTEIACRSCGRDTQITTEWEELFYIAQNGPNRPLVLPQGWRRSEKNMDVFETINCPRCGNQGLHIHYNPERAQRLLHEGYQKGHINDQQIEYWKRKIQGFRAR
jgi:ribosomal protein L37E